MLQNTPDKANTFPSHISAHSFHSQSTMATLVYILVFLALTGSNGVGDSSLQKSLDYACGAGADCSPILQSGACYQPNTIKDHCNYAVNSYFQRKGQATGTCDFSGTATQSANPPSSQTSTCVYPSSGSTSTTPSSGTPPTTSTTNSTSTTPTTGTGTTTTLTPSTPFGISPTSIYDGTGAAALAPVSIWLLLVSSALTILCFSSVELRN